MSNRKRHTSKSNTSMLDIIIATGGRFDMLRKCLQALEAQKNAPPFSVYIIDNNTDNKERLYNKDVFEMPVITETKRLTNEVGFPKANNEGVRIGNSPLILFLNDDVELMPDALKIMVDTLDDEQIGIVGAKLTFPVDSASKARPAGRVQHIGMGMGINSEMVHPLVGWSSDNPKCNISREVISVTGACLMTRRSLFRQLGGFFEGYGAGTFEDVDYCFGVQSLEKKVYINVDAQGTHYTGATVEKKQRGYPLQQNNLIFRARWQSSGLFRWTSYEFM